MAKVTGYADPFKVHAFVQRYAPEFVKYCMGYEIKAKPFGQALELTLTLAVDPTMFEELSTKERPDAT